MKPEMVTGQLPLALSLHAHASFDSYVAGSNRLAVGHVQAVASGERSESVWLAGDEGSGRTHLLAAACHAAQNAGLRPMYLSLEADGDAGQLENLDSVDVLALDNIDRIAGSPNWETALFPVVNARLSRGGLIIAAATRPHDCGFQLDDLLSRLAAAAVYRLAALADADLAQLVMQQARQRALDLDDASVSYLLQRVSRNPGRLVSLLDRVDRYALATQRKVTIPLLRQVIELAGNEEV